MIGGDGVTNLGGSSPEVYNFYLDSKSSNPLVAKLCDPI